VKPNLKSTLTIALSALAASGVMVASSAAKQSAAPPPATAAALPSADDFGLAPVIRGVQLSPDGKHLLALTSSDGETSTVSIWRTDDPTAAPKVLGAGGPNRIVQAAFAKNERVVVTMRQTYSEGTTKTHIFRSFFVDFDGKDWRSVMGGRDQNEYVAANVIDYLPQDPRNVLVQSRDGVYKVDIYSGKADRIYASSDKFGNEITDLNGDIRARSSVDFENGNVYIAQWIRDPRTNQWSEHFRWFAKDRETKDIVGFSTDPNIVYVASNAGRDKTAIYEYDVAQRKFLEPVFEHKLFDATGIVYSDAPGETGKILGFRYDGETQKTYWVDERMAALDKGVRQALGVSTVPVSWTDIATGERVRFSTPDGADVFISNWSNDFKHAIVVKTGPKLPPEYYLYSSDGKLTKLGSQRPTMNTAALGDTRLVQYPARDGLIVPAFLTTPNKAMYGPGPYPAIIVPHGGPWARDDMSWDASGWVQYFAARGYAVLQPQFRGSQGWGQKLWRAGDNEWGQKMQDDKDDGAKWLIAQGIAAPDRIAMHGYSYGGYSAMTAAVRPNGLYQCAVAGAGVAELSRFREIVGRNRILRELQRPTMEGLSPMEYASQIKIPLFLYSGDRDVTVPIKESERFYAQARSSGQTVKMLTIKDMGHQYNRWEAGQTQEVLVAVENFLRNDCGPGGL
jgi:dipeptidyl aminopeptidase/acylaminoacyl peptidase